MQNCFRLAQRSMVYSRDLQKHLSARWVSCIIDLLPCFCCYYWHVLSGWVRKIQTAMQCHSLLIWKNLTHSVSSTFSFKQTPWSCMVKAGATVKPLTMTIPQGGVWVYCSADWFHVTSGLEVLYFWPVPPCALVHVLGVPLIRLHGLFYLIA